MQDPTPKRLAILIDAENVLPGFAETIFSQAEAMGEIVVKEIYGVAAALNTWVEPVLKFAIHPNLTIRASKGKNTSDIALVIGAMDVLLKNDVNAVIIASSDSDFSGLSVRLRTSGIQVIGMGTEKSNPLWRTACSSFIVLEPQTQKASQNRPQAKPQPRPQPRPQQPPKPPQQPAPAPQAEKPVQPTSSHQDRVESIGRFILKRLASNGGRVQTSTLFSALNKLQDYQADRQLWGKRPLNFLKSTYADQFDFEATEDGNVWISVKGPAEAQAPVETEITENVDILEAPEPAIEDASVVEVTSEAPEEQLEEVEVNVEPEEVQEPQIDEVSESQDAKAPTEDPLITSFMTQLSEDGLPQETIDRIVQVFSEVNNMRAAYNAMRRAFGNKDGRTYYYRARDILNQLRHNKD